jgi:hypothetical protein
MNNLRTPITILVVIIVALVGWFVWAHQSAASAPAAVQTQTATTTLPEQVQSAPITTAPTLDPTVVAQNMVGSWQSVDDPNYSISVTASGKWTDSYQGSNASSSVSETGDYTIFTSTDPDKDFTGILVPGVVYVKVAEGTTISYFSVLQASGNELQLSYLDRGTTLSFIKTQ